MLLFGQERSRGNAALAAEPCCAPDTNSRRDTQGLALQKFLTYITTPEGWPLLLWNLPGLAAARPDNWGQGDFLF